ncbi:MAG TPA: radical SAM protein, partial [Methanocorpusculum sp.]|nr:radical SAM protein [Methanocorpusculum sp.]
MVHLTVDIGGKPGVNCRGFCAYCYFKHAKDVPPFGCRYCLPFKKGCDYCTRGVKEEYADFYSLKEVADNFLADLQSVTGDITRITISGGGDPSCYPEFKNLMEILGSLGVPLHIGYTSGKGFDDVEIADFLIQNNLSEISFTVFASDPELRRKYMHDPTPEASLAVLERLAAKIDVYAACVIIALLSLVPVLLMTEPPVIKETARRPSGRTLIKHHFAESCRILRSDHRIIRIIGFYSFVLASHTLLFFYSQ